MTSTTPTAIVTKDRLVASRPFLILALLAVIAGGLVSALTAHNPQRQMMWMCGYLVLVAGLAQATFGLGQALLAKVPPTTKFRYLQCAFFNVSSAGVIASQITALHALVYPATLLFVLSMALFLIGTRDGQHRRWLWTYRVLVGAIGTSSLVGIGLSWRLHGW